jgi:DNA-binding NarL/FixJ family response regulator
MRILCADNSPVSRIGISKTLAKFDYTIDREVESFSQLIAQLESSQFDLLITELRFHDAEFLDVVDQIQGRSPDLKILIYTFHVNPTYVARSAAHNLYDFVLKNTAINRLIQSVAAAKEGAAPADSLLLKASKFLSQPARTSMLAAGSLTKRELQILTHLSLGLSNREISAMLMISLETVKEHVQNILRKLKSADRTEAAVWALRNGIPTLSLSE